MLDYVKNSPQPNKNYLVGYIASCTGKWNLTCHGSVARLRRWPELPPLTGCCARER